DLSYYDLIVPNWTQGQITNEQLTPLLEAIAGGVGLAGLHGGMGDSFRMAVDYQFMTGGQWVAHPGNDKIDYVVNILDADHPLSAGMEESNVYSEQYCMLVYSAVKVRVTA